MMPKNFIAFLILVSLVLGIIFIWLPKYQEFQVLNLRVKAKKTELQNKERYFSNLSEIYNKLKQEYSSEIEKIDLALPTDPSVFDLILLFKKLASENGLIFKEFNVKTSPDTEPKETSVKISLFGSYSSLKNFISALEKSARFFNLNLISFSSSQKEEEKKEGIFKFELTIKTYSY